MRFLSPKMHPIQTFTGLCPGSRWRSLQFSVIPRIVLLSVGIHTDKCVISGLLSVWIRTAVCASIYHTIHTLVLTLTLILTLSITLNPMLTVNLTLISSYLTNKHQYPQPNMSANWMTSRLRDQSAARCRTIGRFLLAVLTIRGFVSRRPTDNNIYVMPQFCGPAD